VTTSPCLLIHCFEDHLSNVSCIISCVYLQAAFTFSINERRNIDGGYIGTFLTCRFKELYNQRTSRTLTNQICRVCATVWMKITSAVAGIIKWLLGNRSDRWTSFLARQTLEDATSYQQAKHLLTNSTLRAPVYFILGGTKSHEVNCCLCISHVLVNLFNADPIKALHFVIQV